MTIITISQAVEYATQKLLSVHDTARLDAEVLVANVLNYSRTQLYTWPEKKLSAHECLSMRSCVRRRSMGEPIAYIVGRREFWSMNFKVSPETLIPRPESEHLVEIALQTIPLNKKWTVADLGTGTGIIAISLAKERPMSDFLAIDKSESALKIAEHNAHHLVAPNVIFKQSDWFGSLTGQIFDLIVTNPPYVKMNDEHLVQGDVASEPRSALVSGKDGLDDIREIVMRAKEHLVSGAYLLFEHGCDQASEVQELLTRESYTDVQSVKDLAGIERITFGKHD